MTAEGSVQDYFIVWIAALAIERSAASAMLDETHQEPEDFVRHSRDDNVYEWGRIYNHNIVITSLPTTAYGKVNAADTVGELLASLPQIKFGFLVGIGAGVPAHCDVRLGDVVIGVPDKSHGGVIQYDLGKQGEEWELKGTLKAPPSILLKALGRLQAEHESKPPQFYQILDAAFQKNLYWAARYARPSIEDRLLRDGEEVIRQPRKSNEPEIHYGTIASGDTLLKNANDRDRILTLIGRTCKCIEMEAAGILNKLPCIVIRGICDYADSIKNDDWQRYASATAAAFAKELLLYVPRSGPQQLQNAVHRNVAQHLSHALNETTIEDPAKRNPEKVTKLLRLLNVCPYDERKDRNPKAVKGTCQWFVQHTRFLDWFSAESPGLLWTSADPGAGKSTLARYLIDKVLNVNKDKIICYFFFKEDFQDQRNGTIAMCSILRQLLIQLPTSAKIATADQGAYGNNYQNSFTELWKTFIKISKTAGSIICVFDALDECQKDDRTQLIATITNWLETRPQGNLKFLLTSRPHRDIRDDFYSILIDHPTIHLGGENEEEATQISKEVDAVVRYRISLLKEKRSLSSKEEAYLVEKFLNIPNRTYLWAHLTLHLVETALNLAKGHLMRMLQSLPYSVSEAYEKMLQKSPNPGRTGLLLHILVAAQRPLSVMEVSCALSMAADIHFDELDDVVEPEERFRQSVRDMCGLIVVIVDGRVYFLHQTVREFLDSHKSPERQLHAGTINTNLYRSQEWAMCIDSTEAHRVLAIACLRFLVTEQAKSFDEIFFGFCCQYWPFHFHKTDISDLPLHDTELALQLCQRWSEEYCYEPASVRDYHGLPSGLRDDKWSALTFAAWFGLISVVRLWLKENHPLDSAHQTISWALYVAVRAEHFKIAKVLLNHGADPNFSYKIVVDESMEQTEELSGMMERPLASAILSNDISLIALLLEHQADVNDICIYNDHFWYRPLHIAANNRVVWWNQWNQCDFPDQRQLPYHRQPSISRNAQDDGILELLLQYGADRTLRAWDKQTALHLYLDQDRKFTRDWAQDIVKLLLVPDSDINQICELKGGTWLKFASLVNSPEGIESLIELGASYQVFDAYGNTILHDIAASHHRSEFVERCIDVALRAGVPVDSPNSIAQTSLAVASIWGNSKACIKLLDSGADLEAIDNRGQTPVISGAGSGIRFEKYASKSQHITPWTVIHPDRDPINFHRERTEVTKILVQAGANLAAQDVSGLTCVHVAASSGTIEQLEMFLQQNANANSQDFYGRTPLMLLIMSRWQSNLSTWYRYYGTMYNIEDKLEYWIQLLLRYSADVHLTDHGGLTALDYHKEELHRLENTYEDWWCLSPEEGGRIESFRKGMQLLQEAWDEALESIDGSTDEHD